MFVTSRNSPHNYEHVPSYRQRSHNNLVKAFLFRQGKVLTGFKDNFIAPNAKIPALDT